MKLTLLPLQDDHLIRLRCEGHVTSPHLSAEGDPVVGLLGPQCHGRKVLINMDQVRSIDTGGVCWLMALDKQFRQAGGRIVFYSVPGVVLDVLNVLRLVQHLPIAAGEDEATAQAVRAPRRDGAPADNSLRPHG
jgi:hypothetical protein